MRTERGRPQAAGARRLVVGLGNPGRKHYGTRHNIGAEVVAALPKLLQQPPLRRLSPVPARVSLGRHLLAVPSTFMNNSGRAVQALLRLYRLPPSRLLVVHDDKDLAFGKLKLQFNRSSAGHRGVQSIIDALGASAFWRLRIGIGPPPPGVDTDRYVLAIPPPPERAELAATIQPRALEIIRRALASPL